MLYEIGQLKHRFSITSKYAEIRERSHAANTICIQHSFLVWCGDLNYRVNLNESVIKNWLRQGKLDTLLEYDQLSIERSAGRTFPMFDEGYINFAPTYKYDAGTNQYDTRYGEACYVEEMHHKK